MDTSVQELIDSARLRHWSFSEGNEGAALRFVSDRQKRIMLDVIKATEALLGETSEVTTAVVGAALVALDDLGVPYFTTTVEDGFCVRFLGAVPYIDTSLPYVIDPFGASGDSVPGFPLPTDLLRLMSVTAISSLMTVPAYAPIPVDIIEQRIAEARGGSTRLRAFVSVGRIIPVRTDVNDIWNSIIKLRLSMVRCPTLTALTDPLTLPEVCLEALTAALAEMFSLATEKCPTGDKRAFKDARIDADKHLMDSAENILDSITSSSVVVR